MTVTHVAAQLLLGAAIVMVLAVVLAWAWCCGVFAVAPGQLRRERQAAALRVPVTPAVVHGIRSPRPLAGGPTAASVPRRIVRGTVIEAKAAGRPDG
jgi:hypothetical protein